MSRATGPGPRRGERVMFEGPAGAVYLRTTRAGRIHIRAYRNDGDRIAEVRLASLALDLYRAAYLSVTGSDLALVGVQTIDDHEPAA